MPLTILVVDDDLGTRLSISDYLEMSGYLVAMAENGKQALTLVDQVQPHLIVTDVAMPQMDGYELVRQVRLQPSLRLLPVIFLTALSTTEERIRGYQLGCDAYLPKPFDLKELGAVVRNLLERSQMIQTEWRRQIHSSEGGESGMAQAGSGPLSAVEQETDLMLTVREQGVLSLLADGLSNSQIGDRLHLSPRTVEKYVSSLLRKTNTSNRAELVRYVMDHHLVE
ncbi:MAG: response regulator transcription factor [Cyanobacteria bacterium J069]|nr:MAG: DNA-binding response regulator [Cyanobacteria bacterium J069]